MKNYKRPVVLTNEELAEGVYAASGDQNWDRVDGNYSLIRIPGVVAGQMVTILFTDGTSVTGTYTENGFLLIGADVQKEIKGYQAA